MFIKVHVAHFPRQRFTQDLMCLLVISKKGKSMMRPYMTLEYNDKNRHFIWRHRLCFFFFFLIKHYVKSESVSLMWDSETSHWLHLGWRQPCASLSNVCVSWVRPWQRDRRLSTSCRNSLSLRACKSRSFKMFAHNLMACERWMRLVLTFLLLFWAEL